MVYGLSLWFKVSFFFQKHFLKRARARARARDTRARTRAWWSVFVEIMSSAEKMKTASEKYPPLPDHSTV
jgi:hypothetical protein